MKHHVSNAASLPSGALSLVMAVVLALTMIWSPAGLATSLGSVPDDAEPSTSALPAPGRLEFLPLRPLLFEHDVDVIAEHGKLLLEDMAKFIRNDPRITRVLIRGHADHIAGGPYNEALARRRAEAAREHLLELGVQPWLLHTTARGNSTPVDEEWTPEGRARNRRVEIYVVRLGD